MLENWLTPHCTPPFSRIRTEHFAPAVRTAIAEAAKEVDEIVAQKEWPTFENTIERLEMASERLDTIVDVMMNLNECNTTPELQQTVMELIPDITRHENSIRMNEQLFLRVKTLYAETFDSKEAPGLPVSERRVLTEEQRQVLEKYYQYFVRGGVELDAEDKQQFSAYTEELATLTEQFSHNVLADTNDFELHITNRADLSGLPDTAVAAAREEAAKRGKDGWVFTLQAPSYRPFMAYADNRELREMMWRAYNSRGNRGNANDNNALVRRIAELRLRLARLLCYEDYASYSLVRTMAETSQAVNEFLQRLYNACLPYAKRDLAEVQAFASECGADFELQSWDFSYYSEKLKKHSYDFDAELLRPYFQLERVWQGIKDLYGALYGLSFREAPQIEVYREDVKVYEVYDSERFMGVLYLDMFPSDGKRSGAWKTKFRSQSNISAREVRPQIQVVCNFSKPMVDSPSLLRFDEVETFMHEMGHAMHGMLSDVHYPSVSGTSVRHDFVEMPSQVMENWCYETEFLNLFAKHYQSGEPLPAEYIDKIRRSENYIAGWLCLRQLNFGMTDMAFHTLTEPLDEKTRIEDFERRHTTNLLPAVEGACTSTAFTHIFSGGYAAGYYGYKWAEVLDADVFSRFKADGIFNKETAKAFREKILSKGGSEHPSVLFRDFMGRDPDNGALLRRCGFS